MSERYLVQIHTPTVTPVIVVANSPSEAHERALNGEGNPNEQWQEEPEVKRVIKLES